MEARAIEATIHGRYLTEGPDDAPLLLGFHGYGEDAEAQLELYSGDKLQADERALASQQADIEARTFACGHEWTAEISQVAGRFLDRVGGD